VVLLLLGVGVPGFAFVVVVVVVVARRGQTTSAPSW